MIGVIGRRLALAAQRFAEQKNTLSTKTQKTRRPKHAHATKDTKTRQAPKHATKHARHTIILYLILLHKTRQAYNHLVFDFVGW
jgi:hypothetical protein